jgi:ElaB/YqjD/DUF883 family membrane-anchored ribosome-binding protein
MADEDDQTYRRRRDHARASYFMIEQGHDEDEGAFRRRLDAATDGLRQRRERMSERAHTFADNTRDRSRHLAENTRDRSRHLMEDARGFYFDNPLVSGLAAAFAGAVAGSALPASRTEEDYVGGIGEQAIDAAGARARQAGDKALERKDEMVDRADAKIGQGGKQPQGQTLSGQV